MLNLLKSIYEKMPISISSKLIRIFGLNPYNAKKTWRYIEHIEKNYKNKKLLKENLLKVKENCFYKNRNEKFIDSDELRVNFEKIINKNIKGYYTSTGGSGRNPSKLYLSNKSYKIDINHVIWAWRQLGYKKGDKKITLRGTNLGEKLYKFNPIYNELQINTFLMSKKNIDDIIKAVEKFNPVFGHGYPSAFVRFSKLIGTKKLNFKLKGISLASEGFNEVQRDIIEEKFKCPTRGFFGHSERACFATETLNKKGVYNVLLTYGLIEIIKDNGEIAKNGEEGEIVCTGFTNEAMPLIRYKTGDYATVNKIEDGIVLEIKNIKGRWGKDFVYDLEGNSISTTSINVHSKEQYNFKNIQLFQEKKGELLIKLVPLELDIDLKKSEKELIKNFKEKLKNIKIKSKIVVEKEIYKTHRGKVPYLVSYIKGVK